MSTADLPLPPDEPPKSRWLPPIGTWQYYVLLGAIAIFVLGPLGGVTAAYMNFSLGFFVGGQVLAGILGSAVTYGYGAEGKHGANYMQTMAASVAGMSGMAVLVQAMVWLGLPQPPALHLIAYFLCIGMFGVGVGMLYTPFLVDRMQLTFPSGFAVANILRALTDKKLLQSSIGKLGSGAGMGFIGGILSTKLGALGAIGLSSSTFGAGMVVGARIAVPGMVVGLIGEEMVPTLVSAGWLESGEPFRKIGFIIALGSILGAAIIDIALVLYTFVRELGAKKEAVAPADAWKQQNIARVVAWVLVWGAGVFAVGVGLLGLPLLYVSIAMALVFVFLVINGISTGISDSNPISSAFVLSVFALAAAGLTDPAIGLMCAAILLIATSLGVDMQQDRSTGWRLGTNRTIQFRYQVIGVVMGSVMSVGFAHVFMTAYPYLEVNQFASAAEERASEQAAERAVAEAEASRAERVTLAGERSRAAAAGVGAAQLALTDLERRAAAGEAIPPEALLVASRELALAAAAATEASELAAQAVAPTVAPVDEATVEAERQAAEQREQESAKWGSAMTYKFVGALASLTPPAVDPSRLDDPAARAELEKYTAKKAITMNALWLGVAIGFVIELLRKIIKRLAAWKRFATSGKIGFASDFCLDTFLLPSPYAASFGGFVEFIVTVWFAGGGVLTSFAQTIEEEVLRPYKRTASLPLEGEVVPEDMSTTSLVGGGLIAGDSLAALAIGLVGLGSALLG